MIMEVEISCKGSMVMSACVTSVITSCHGGYILELSVNSHRRGAS